MPGKYGYFEPEGPVLTTEKGTVTVVSCGPVLNWTYLHSLQSAYRRRKVSEFLEERHGLWDRALDASLPLADLEEAWAQVFEELRDPLGAPFVIKSEFVDRDTVDKTVYGPSEVVITPRVFRRIYTHFALEPFKMDFPASSGVWERRECHLTKDAVKALMHRRFHDLVGIEDESYPDSTWQQLRGLNLRAFVLLVAIHTVLFVADAADSCDGQQKIGTFLATCEERLFDVVNHRKDGLGLETQEEDTV